MLYYCDNYKKCVINYYNTYLSIQKVLNTFNICRKHYIIGKKFSISSFEALLLRS